MVLELQRLAREFRKSGHIAEANVLAAQAEVFRAAGMPEIISERLLIDDGNIEDNAISEVESEFPEKVPFKLIPDGIHPGMQYTTPNELAKSEVTKYSSNHIRLLAERGEIESFHIAGSVLLTPIPLLTY